MYHMVYRRTLASGLALLALLLLQSCGWMPPSEVENTQLSLPTEYQLYQAGEDVSRPWWTQFGSAELDSLIQLAMSDNLTLMQAYARLQQAQATARQAGAYRYPALNASAAASQKEVRTENGTDPVTQITSETYGTGLAASWELDLWGRVNATARSSAASLAAVEEDLAAAQQSIAAEITLTWLELIAADANVSLLQQQLDDQEARLELSELGYRKGYYDAATLQQQRLSTAERKSAIPAEVSRRENLRQQLNLLLGRPPMTELVLATTELPCITTLPEMGLPAELLSQRPDLRATGRRLYALEWSVKAARAARLPAISLSASHNYQAGEMDLLFDNWTTNLASNLAMPVFAGGRLQAGVDLAQAKRDESFAAYKAAVLSAVAEVEIGMLRVTQQETTVEAVVSQLNAARGVLRQTEQGYLSGVNDYQSVLSARNTVFGLERSLLTSNYTLLAYRVALYRALGGDWMKDYSVGDAQ